MEYWDIEARGLTKAFGSFTAARNLNLRVPRGTIFGFLGPNGSGKSTTVKMLTGLLTPTEGEALIAGEPVAVENVALNKMRFYRDSGGGSIFDALIGMTLCSLPGVAIIYLTQFNSEMLAAKFVSILALTALVYLVSLHFAGRKFERDWQKISYRLL